jgi:uridine phosphorylase
MGQDQIKASELILNPDGSLYHLHLKEEHIANTVLLVGDQERVLKISQYFDTISHRSQNREFICHTGTYRGKRISVLSTGIGTDNIDIVINELDAAVNIDPETRLLRPNRRSLDLIRIGTSGAIREEIPVDSFVISKFALGLDGLVHYYKKFEHPDEQLEAMEKSILAQLNWDPDLPKPYLRSASNRIFDLLEEGMIPGITVSATGFYGPQGRRLFLELRDNDMHEKLKSVDFEGHRIANFEMETSALFGLSQLLGHSCCSCCAILANRATGTFTEDHEGVVDKLIETVLDRLAQA